MFNLINYNKLDDSDLNYSRIILVVADSIEQGKLMLQSIPPTTCQKLLYLDTFTLEEKISALDSGAIDCLDRQMTFREILARIRVYFRAPKQLHSNLPIQFHLQPLTAHSGKSLIPLTKMELKIVMCLYFNLGKVIPRKYLLLYIRNFNSVSESRAIDTHLGSIRKKLNTFEFVTKSGVGVKMT